MGRIKGVVVLVMASMLLLMLAVACGDDDDDAGAVEERIVEVTRVVEVAADQGPKEFSFFSVYHTWPHPFWNMMERAANLAGDHTNTDVNFWIGTEYSVEDQVNRVEIVSARDPDGMAVSIPDASAADSVYRAAIDAGIPMIAVNARDPRPRGERIPYLFYVGSDETIAGNRTAEEILDRVGQPARVAFASQRIAAGPLLERAQGVQQVLEPLGVPVDLVDISDDPAQAIEVIKGWMASNPDTEWFVCGGAVCSSFVVDALKELGILNNPVGVSGFDLGEVITPHLKDGSLSFTIDQQAYLQGYLPIVWLYLFNTAGFLPAGDVLTGPSVVDKSNIDVVAELADIYR